MGAVLSVDDSNFEAEVLRSEKPVLVDFTASWCGPCRMLGPELDALAESGENLKIVKIDIGGNAETKEATNPETAQKFGTGVFPALALFRDGKAVDVIFGAAPRQILSAWADQALATPAESDIDLTEFQTFAAAKLEQQQRRQNEQLAQKVASLARKFQMVSSTLKLAGTFALATFVPGAAAAVVGGIVGGVSALDFYEAYKGRRSVADQMSSTRRGKMLTGLFNAATLVGGIALVGASAGILPTALGGYMLLTGALGTARSVFSFLGSGPKAPGIPAAKAIEKQDCKDGACALPPPKPEN